jgi:hypothetical protein
MHFQRLAQNIQEEIGRGGQPIFTTPPLKIERRESLREEREQGRRKRRGGRRRGNREEGEKPRGREKKK